ncbi:hypothetical protein C6I20_02810 [Aeromicrobium sp. A1-2]|nr:hypothetical protein C6I20_02810 [Aeromicrobium sp. A1-2]
MARRATRVLVEILSDGYSARTSVEGYPELTCESHSNYALAGLRLRAMLMPVPVVLSDQLHVVTRYVDGTASEAAIPEVWVAGSDPSVFENHYRYLIEHRAHLKSRPSFGGPDRNVA